MAEPTLAEVADKTVDHIADAARQIAATIEKLAPGAWEMAVKQHRLEGLTDFAIGAAGLAFVVWAWRGFWRRSEKFDDIDRGAARGFGSFCAGMCLILAIVLMRDGFVEWQGAEYYAARDLIKAVHP